MRQRGAMAVIWILGSYVPGSIPIGAMLLQPWESYFTYIFLLYLIVTVTAVCGEFLIVVAGPLPSPSGRKFVKDLFGEIDSEV